MIVEDSFRALKHGPVPAYTYKALQIAEGKPLDGNFDEFLSDIEVRDKKVYTSAVPDMDYISGANKRCLDAAIAKYKVQTLMTCPICRMTRHGKEAVTQHSDDLKKTSLPL